MGIGIGIGPAFRRTPIAALLSPTFAVDFARDQYSTLSPALTVSSPTGGVMVPDYLGNYHKTLANEIPIRGGRRVRNELNSTGWADGVSGSPGTAPSDWSLTSVGSPSSVFAGGAVTATVSAARWFLYSGFSAQADSSYFLAVEVESVSGTINLNEVLNVILSGASIVSTSVGASGASPVTVGAHWIKVTTTGAGFATARIGAGVSTNQTGSIKIRAPRVYKARPGQTAPDPEYVSRGVPIGHVGEFAINGGFDTDAGWNKSVGWTISGGTAVATAVAPPLLISQINLFPYAGTFKVQFTVLDYVSGAVSVYGPGYSADVQRAANGIYTETVTVTSAGSLEFKTRNASTTLKIDNVSVREIRYHGYGVDGLAWMRTDPDGNSLADAASGYPVLCTGIADWPQVKNLFLHNQDASAWTAARGAATKTNAEDGTVAGGYVELRGLGATGVDDVYALASGFTPNGAVAPALLIRPVDTAGNLQIKNPTGAAGAWAVDLSALPVGVWSLVNRSHPAVTVTSDFVANGGGSCGLWWCAASGSLDVDVAVPTLIDGTLYCPVVIPTASLAVSVTKILKTPSPAAIGLTAGLGTFVIEHTPDFATSVSSNDQVLLDLYTSGTERALVYNQSSNLGVLVLDDGVSQWSANNAAANWVAGTQQRVAVRFVADDGSLVTDGVERFTDTSMTLPTVASIYLGGGATSKYAGSIGAFAYYATGA